MDSFVSLANGFAVALTPVNLMWGLIGVTLGTFVGVLPGLGPALTIAMLLPITFQVEPTAAFILFAGIYFGAMFGGSTTSILINTPGESATIVTALEGHKMARKGRGGPALATAAIGSFVAGTLGVVGITLLAPIIVKFALTFSPADYFALMLLAFVTVSVVLGSTMVRGLTALALGLFIGLIGVDLQTGQARFSFGQMSLLDGVDVVIVCVGLFAVGETLHLASRYRAGKDEVIPIKGSLWMNRQDWTRSWKPWLRGACIGFPIGAMPAGGAEIPTFLSYFFEKKLSKHPEEFGHGAIEGVAGPEAANNASAAGVFVPLLTLGLPTSATAAIMLSAFQSYGINPGPQLLVSQPDLVWGLIASLYIGNVLLLVLNLPLVGLWVQVLKIPTPYLYAGILLFATIGTYGISQSVFDLALLYVIGIIGFFMRRYDFPTSPVIIGMILGPFAEQQFRRAMTISQGDLSVFVTRPISATLIAIAILALVVPLVVQFKRGRRADEPALEGERST
ncbi:MULTISPECIES: tripartite tricarboxylate transporter permease [Agrobacterium]|uniref:Tricarboxylic transport membrane protein n=1 Tax=Agrobacterium tumefaciens TaxID=358 RepID=A0AAW8M2H7_AGRTU|nr:MULTISPECIES: tripartite tricarboxylate transporter permease [Agrobacterium]MBP2511703.1 putative tricarboxylic transport membrane protein [Agrobacterium tumefaciens]MBP2520865.1 putative tricarboxylic transport membrane protein [Agrobacterium tumefaciens]MBP2537558.1 putative tricarboxylic transport membrane protein [Agrobacterium tumefaciens]MBP2542759.1 putative tricarboxylic transport membrane protein [Agrobacterium tumefaciens]MBP2568806.1 putative tricarboxylic transport membrane prot